MRSGRGEGRGRRRQWRQKSKEGGERVV